MKKINLELEIYSYHIDAFGHVSNSAYIQWMDAGRNHLLEEVGLPIHETLSSGFAMVLVHTSITYKAPLYLHEWVDLRLWLSEVRNASITMKFSFWDDELRVVAEGMQRGIFVEMETMRPRRLSSEEKALFLPYLDETVTPIPSCWMD